jgi:hypothetical protein
MAIDFSRYLPPGVYTNPTPGPQLAVNSSLPTAVGLFGMSLGYKAFIESVLINPDTNLTTPAVNRTLAQQGIHTTSIVVLNPNSGAVYALNTDYTILHLDGTNGTSNATYTIQRVITGGHILPGDTVQLTYQYTDPQYFTPYIFFDYTDVRIAYGEPFNTVTGAIQSELTLAAKFAFLNGAYQVVAVAVNPANPSAPTVGEYANALDKLSDEPLVGVVVPCTGTQPLQQLVSEHVDAQSQNRFERRAIVGVDGTTTAVPYSQRILDAQELTDQRVMMVSPATFTYYSPELSNTIILGGQYMAASLAGITMSLSFAQPLTRKRLTGWTGIPESSPDGQKSLESSNGLCVVEVSKRHLIQVRHGVTTDPSDLLTREWSIIGQQDALVYRLRDYLEDAHLIGQPIYSFTLVNVKASAEAALQSLIRDGLLVDYVGLKARQLLTNPDVIEVSFGWLPAFPLNYIVVTFSVSLQTGSITSNSGSTTNLANVTSAGQVTSTISSPTGSSINDFGGPSNTLQSI